MSDLTTASQILAGSGAAGWTAAKLLGPSLDNVGEHVRVFLGLRVSKVFEKVEEKAREKSLNLLPPGFAVEAIRKISISDDEEIVSELWADLLISASESYQSSHLVFVDILSQIGPDEANLLVDIVSKISNVRTNFFDAPHDYVRQELSRSIEDHCVGGDNPIAFALPFLDEMKNFPVVIGYITTAENGLGTGMSGFGCTVHPMQLNILCRQHLLVLKRINHATYIDGRIAEVEVYAPTYLALNFLLACKHDFSEKQDEPRTT